MTPVPPAIAAATKPTRSISGSIPIRCPRPEQTPPSTPVERSRRNGAGCVSELTRADVPLVGRRVLRDGPLLVALGRAGQPAGEQDAADRGEHGREQVLRIDREHVRLVEQQQRAEQDHEDAADQRRGVVSGPRRHAAPMHASRLVPASREPKRSPGHSSELHAKKLSPTEKAPMSTSATTCRWRTPGATGTASSTSRSMPPCSPSPTLTAPTPTSRSIRISR